MKLEPTQPPGAVPPAGLKLERSVGRRATARGSVSAAMCDLAGTQSPDAEVGRPAGRRPGRRLPGQAIDRQPHRRDVLPQPLEPLDQRGGGHRPTFDHDPGVWPEQPVQQGQVLLLEPFLEPMKQGDQLCGG